MENYTHKEQLNRVVRPPIVVVMGHIDHGKSMILETIRKTKMLEIEAGGITQHIGAYEIEYKPAKSDESRKIVFIDTPGHEAFSKLRSRGARVADMAVLVVAADEGVKPQTAEALEIIKKASLPFLVAINKIDKAEANPERVKQELAKVEVLVESYGGKIPSVEISAKTGQNMDELLEVLLLMADLENLSADPTRMAEGVVVEAHLDSRRGVTATLLIGDGTLRLGDMILVGKSISSVKILENFLGKSIKEAGPSLPARVAGLSETPVVGDTFRAVKDKYEAESLLEKKNQEIPELPKSEVAGNEVSEKPIFNVIIKADVAGSVEALEESVKKLESDLMGINILKSEAGDIGESDVKLALATGRVTIVGFRTRIDGTVRMFAEASNIHIITGEIIYDLLDQIRKEIQEFLPPEVRRTEIGRVKILKTFKKDGTKQVVGGRVEEGKIRRGALAETIKGGGVVGLGAVLQLQHNKMDVNEVEQGKEFGVMIDSGGNIQPGDTLKIFEEEVIKKTL